MTNKTLFTLFFLGAFLHLHHAYAGGTTQSVPFSVNSSNSNISWGPGALSSVTTGTFNLAVGINSGSAITVGIGNTIYGTEGVLTTGGSNVFVGTCTAVLGSTSLATCVSDSGKVGSNDIGIGDSVLIATTTNGNSNIAIGNSALALATSGIGNLAVGPASGGGVYTGSYNTFFGYYAGHSAQLITGSSNLVIGPNVGTTTIQSGSNNILIGTTSAIDVTTSATSNFINIGNLYQGDTSVKHVVYGGALSVVTSGATDCGTTPSIAGNDNVGLVTAGTSPSGKCTVTWGSAWTTAPVCICQNNTSGARGCNALSVSTTSMALTATTTPFTAADKLGYRCVGYQL